MKHFYKYLTPIAIAASFPVMAQDVGNTVPQVALENATKAEPQATPGSTQQTQWNSRSILMDTAV